MSWLSCSCAGHRQHNPAFSCDTVCFCALRNYTVSVSGYSRAAIYGSDSIENSRSDIPAVTFPQPTVHWGYSRLSMIVKEISVGSVQTRTSTTSRTSCTVRYPSCCTIPNTNAVLPVALTLVNSPSQTTHRRAVWRQVSAARLNGAFVLLRCYAALFGS